MARRNCYYTYMDLKQQSETCLAMRELAHNIARVMESIPSRVNSVSLRFSKNGSVLARVSMEKTAFFSAGRDNEIMRAALDNHNEY